MHRNARLSTALILTILLTTLGAASAVAEIVGYVPDRIVVTLAEGVEAGIDLEAQAKGGRLRIENVALRAAATATGARSMKRLHDWFDPSSIPGAPDLSRIWAVDLSAEYKSETELETVAAVWRALPECERVEKVAICSLAALPDDPYLVAGQQYYLRNRNLGGKDIRAVGGWAETAGDTNVVIAIIDSGVDWRHPDLGGTGPNYLDGAIAINWTEWHGTAGVDDDGNGKIDDFRGWDFVDGITDGEAGQDVDVEDNDPMDFESHGTAAAGCAAAITDNGVGIAGAGWNCRILPVRVGWLQEDAPVGVVRMDFAADGMIYAAAMGADVINCSWGSSSYLASATAVCAAADCVIVNAAGNANLELCDTCVDGNGDPVSYSHFLCNNPNVLAVAATNSADNRASFSNYGDWIEVCAPGVDILTTYYNRADGSHTYAQVSGTSFASPIVAGAAALIRARRPAWNRTQVMNLLMSSADDIDAINPDYAGLLGSGRINLLAALGDGFLEVPDEFEEFFDAVNAVTPGDTVAILASHVLDGPQEVPARDFHLLGGWDEGYGSRDATGSPTAIVGSANDLTFTFEIGTEGGTVVDGFVCSGGGGINYSSARRGGALFLNGSSPTLRNLEVTGNSVGSMSQLGCGGGLALIDSDARLENVHIHGNTAIHGAGLHIDGGAPVLVDCLIADNTSLGTNLSHEPLGGGVYIEDAEVTMTGCEISGHDEVAEGGGVYVAAGTATPSLVMRDNWIHDNLAVDLGAGLKMAAGSLDATGDRFTANGPAASSTFLTGGGFHIEAATVTLDSVQCLANSADGGAGGLIDGAVCDLRDCLVGANIAGTYAGGLIIGGGAGGSITQCTIADNEGAVAGGGLHLANVSMTLEGNLVAFNTGDGVYASGGALTTLCNDVYGNSGAQYAGLTDPTGVDGNISLDPEFCSGAREMDFNWGLQSDSPCLGGACGRIGAFAARCGETAVLLSEFTVLARGCDVAIAWRLHTDSDRGDFALRASAGEATWSVPWTASPGGLFEAADAPAHLPAGTKVDYALLLADGRGGWSELTTKSITLAATPMALRPAHPNPANPATTITFSLDEPRRVRVSIYDLAGRQIATLVDEDLLRGEHQRIWYGKDDRGRAMPSGTYFTRLSWAGGSRSGKLLLVR